MIINAYNPALPQIKRHKNTQFSGSTQNNSSKSVQSKQANKSFESFLANTFLGRIVLFGTLGLLIGASIKDCQNQKEMAIINKDIALYAPEDSTNILKKSNYLPQGKVITYLQQYTDSLKGGKSTPNKTYDDFFKKQSFTIEKKADSLETAAKKQVDSLRREAKFLLK